MGRTACTEPQCLYKGDLYLSRVIFSTKIEITEKLLSCNFRLIVTFISVEDICTLNRNAYLKLEVGQKCKKTVTGM
jgi:hypothetical protein